MTEPDDVHELDAPLGVIHEIALKLHFSGQTEMALALAEAHEQIQGWLVIHG